MGAARWYLTKRPASRGDVLGEYVAGGNHTTSTTASNLTDGAAGAGSAVTASVGQILTVTCSELARVVVGGGTATATSGYLLQPDIARDIEVSAGGTVSIIDEA